MKTVGKIDASVSAYRELLDKEFQSKWDALARRKSAKQEKLFEADDNKQRKLIR